MHIFYLTFFYLLFLHKIHKIINHFQKIGLICNLNTSVEDEFWLLKRKQNFYLIPAERLDAIFTEILPTNVQISMHDFKIFNSFSAVSRSLRRVVVGGPEPQIEWNRQRMQLAIRKAQNEALIRIRSVVHSAL